MTFTDAELDTVVFSLAHLHPDDVDMRYAAASIEHLRAQLASRDALGAAVMRERAAATCLMVDQTQGEPETQFDKGYDQACVENAEIILKLPLPTHAEMLAHALTLPEIKALRDLADEIASKNTLACDGGELDWFITDAREVLAALEPK